MMAFLGIEGHELAGCGVGENDKGEVMKKTFNYCRRLYAHFVLVM